MNIMEAMEQRHAVRNYDQRKISEVIKKQLVEEIEQCNQEGKLAIQLVTEDETVFKGLKAHFGGFRGVRNYIALVGPKGDIAEEQLGYYGERIVLKAQQLGLNSCWVAVTYKKEKCKIVLQEEQDLLCVIALGYGVKQGVAHKSKPMEELCKVNGTMPTWFIDGMKAAMLAPTAMNKQNFLILLSDGKPVFQKGEGKYGNIDIGIVKYHFEVGSQKK
ncbi:nitroreductase family protein [Anaerosporobacter faecicola]|uniref:nitroreductase family protein n=1 Tax=Anaerosporobacter faecicola TaxID=2718714 RepID=UPI00143A176F|nr:nitroreductase family protein [Anaerosporobacter faecicola]